RALRRQRQPAGAPRPAAFVTLQHGMGQLASELAGHLAGRTVTRAPVTTISRADHGYAVHLSDGRQIAARVIVVATPAAVAACLLATVAPDAANRLLALQTRDTGSMTLAYPATAIRRAPPGYGVVIPRAEQRPINAITVATAKFPGRAPEGWSLLRVFFGGARSPESMALDDQRLLDVVQRELRDLFGINAEPALYRVYRWRAGSPLYDVGHMDRVAEIEHALPRGILVTGSAYRGVGIPDITRQAERAARAAAEAVMSPGGSG
ncbi:MAG: protoporphyrinogen oxidase, partial [Chloroflexota bacterium]